MTLSLKQKNLLIELVNKCEICSSKNNELNKLVVHHIKRKSQGGTDNHRNLEVLCEKHHRMIHSGETW